MSAPYKRSGAQLPLVNKARLARSKNQRFFSKEHQNIKSMPDLRSRARFKSRVSFPRLVCQKGHFGKRFLKLCLHSWSDSLHDIPTEYANYALEISRNQSGIVMAKASRLILRNEGTTPLLVPDWMLNLKFNWLSVCKTDITTCFDLNIDCRGTHMYVCCCCCYCYL